MDNALDQVYSSVIMLWPKLYQHIKDNTKLIVISCCDDYRKKAKAYPQANDQVLEIGSSTGMATQYLAESAKQVLAVDNSFQFIEQSQNTFQHLNNVQFIHLDARDVSAVKAIMDKPDIIFIDIGGDSQLGNICSILRLYLTHFNPRLVVIRNFELAILHQLIQHSAPPSEQDHRVKQILNDPLAPLQHLLELSHSDTLSDRIFAARKLRKLQHPAAKQRLRELCDDPKIKLRKICLDALRYWQLSEN